MSGNISLKYPIVLVHGIIAHDRPSIIKYWGKIPETLREAGARVFLGNTDSWGDYESNAKLLKTTIDNVLYETNSDKVNIIAHSKGGLDSRYFIWKYDYGSKVASLTTIATPHHGAELADMIYKRKIVHTWIAKKAIMLFGKLYGDKNPDLFNVNYQLTTDYMNTFNKNVLMDEKVYYQNFYTVMKNSFDDILFFNSHRKIKKASGDNDGFVSEYSAKWGNNNMMIKGGISHGEILDFKMKKISGINIPDIYRNIVNGLSEKGF
ncbi:MAG: alpha/beta hydrolase [Spirochaetaceae bacterium]|jgi:triacylglycerol lipase|nr:alpha/beta hydrolase [Spirochaetaceae bacterium]